MSQISPLFIAEKIKELSRTDTFTTDQKQRFLQFLLDTVLDAFGNLDTDSDCEALSPRSAPEPVKRNPLWDMMLELAKMRKKQ